MMLKRKAGAESRRRCKHPVCPRNRCAAISAPPAHRYSIAHTVIQRPQHQHPNCSLRHSVCLHPPSMVLPCRAAAAFLRCFKHPSCPQYRCTAIFGRNMCRDSIARAANQSQRNCTQLSERWRLPASKHDATAQSYCVVSHVLQSPQLPPATGAPPFLGATCADTAHRSRALLAL